MLSMWACVTDKGFHFHRLWLRITHTEVIVYPLSILGFLLISTVGMYNIHMGMRDALNALRVPKQRCRCYRSTPEGIVSWKGWVFMNRDFQPTYGIPRNSVAQRELLEELVARERDGNRS